ncbi:MAG: hypothetical protein HY606_10545 [Planctomycetes bacterium]|nr:hypothetical protein [Planctomycetota bacterium]
MEFKGSDPQKRERTQKIEYGEGVREFNVSAVCSVCPRRAMVQGSGTIDFFVFFA